MKTKYEYHVYSNLFKLFTYNGKNMENQTLYI